MDLKFLPGVPLALWGGPRTAARSDEPRPDGKVAALPPPGDPGGGDSTAIAIRDRSARALPLAAGGAPVVIGCISRAETARGRTDAGWAAFVSGLVTGAACTASFFSPDANDGEPGVYPLAPLFAVLGAGLGTVLGYRGYQFVLRRHEARAERAEQALALREGWTARQQLDRIVALATRQALTRSGLARCMQRLQEVQRLHPTEVSGKDVGRAIVRLALEGALAIPPAHDRSPEEFNADLVLLGEGIRRQHTNGLLEPQALQGLLQALASGLMMRPGALRVPPEQVLAPLLEILGGLYPDTPGSQTEGPFWRAALALVTDTRPHDIFLQRALVERLFLPQDLPVERILGRMRHLPGCPAWLLDPVVHHLGDGAQAVTDLASFEAFTGDLVALARAHGELNAHTLERLFKFMRAAKAQLPDAVAPAAHATLRARLAGLAHSQGPRLTWARMMALVSRIQQGELFAEPPSAEETTTLVASLVSADTAPSIRQNLLTRTGQWIDTAVLRTALGDRLGAPALLEALRRVPAARLAGEVASARTLLAQGHLDSLAQARLELQLMDTLCERDDTPVDVRDLGLKPPASLTPLITAIAAAPPGASNQDRGEVIARLMQLGQGDTTEPLLRHAVATLVQLPEYAPTGQFPEQDARRRAALLGLVLDACTRATLYISAQAEREAARREAGAEGIAQEGQPGPVSAAIHHDWLTPALMAELAAPLMEPRESKHG